MDLYCVIFNIDNQVKRMKTHKLITLIVLLLAFCVFEQSKNQIITELTPSSQGSGGFALNSEKLINNISEVLVSNNEGQQSNTPNEISQKVVLIAKNITYKIINSKF